MEASIAEVVVTPLMSLILGSLLRRVSYVVKVGEKVKNLEEKMEELNNLSEDIKSDVTSEVEDAKKRGQTRRCAQLLEGWLEKVPSMDNEVRDINSKYEQLGRWCFGRCSGDIISMYKIGRNATKKLAEVTDLYQKLGKAKKNNQSLTQAAPSPPGQEMPGTSNLIATESYLSKVLGYLADGVGVVGIFGMGGVGKTTLLKRINNSLSRGGNINSNSDAVSAAAAVDDGKRVHFDCVIWVTVSKDGAEVQRLQDVIAKQLNLTADDKSSWTNKISNFLRNKRFVLLLDDVWKGLDLNEIGIPDQGRVVFTTRSEDVCGAMKAESKVKVEVLEPEHAWRLFQENARNEHIKSDEGIEKLARQIAEECGGLPLALITIGRAMSTKRTSGEWRHALKSLKDSKLAAAIPEANAEMIMTTLKFSYDNLVNDKTRECFLCCALFPEDYDISKEELIECLLGHGVIDSDEFSDIGEIYDYGDTLIGNLISACLLLESERDEEKVCVKMHDIIRDTALWIANDCKEDSGKWIVRAGLWSDAPLKETDKWEYANRISLALNNMMTLPEPKQQICPNLSTLMFQRNRRLERIPKGFFRHFPALTYLDMSYTDIKIFPEEVTMLVHLQYLNLSSTDIESLSLNSWKALTKLRYLILHYCQWLKNIPQEFISSLPNLQVLDLFGSEITFDLSIVHPIDEVEGEEGKDKKVEVEELKRLKGRRRIKALGLNVMLREFSSLDEYIDCMTIWKLRVYGCPSDSCPIRDTLMVGKNIEILWLNAFCSLRELTMSSDDRDGRFSRLRELILYGLSRLEKIIWKRPTTVESTFPELKSISIWNCQITDISWIRHATSLEVLNVRTCEALSNIIIRDEEEKGTSITFRNLKEIHLIGLPRLRNIYEGTIYCPSLAALTLLGCEGLTRLPFDFHSHIVTSTNNRRLLIDAKPKWWWSLKWEDDNIKSQLEPFVDFLEEDDSEDDERNKNMEEDHDHDGEE